MKSFLALIHNLPAIERDTARRVLRAIHIRWLILSGVALIIAAAEYFTVQSYAVIELSIILLSGAVINCVYAGLLRYRVQHRRGLFRALNRFMNIQAVGDTVVLMGIIYLTGTLTSPFLAIVPFYLIMLAFLIEQANYKKHLLSLCVGIVLLGMAEHVGLVRHYSIGSFSVCGSTSDPVYVATALFVIIGSISLIGFLVSHVALVICRRADKMAVLEEDLTDAQINLSKYDRQQSRFIRNVVTNLNESLTTAQNVIDTLQTDSSSAAGAAEKVDELEDVVFAMHQIIRDLEVLSSAHTDYFDETTLIIEFGSSITKVIHTLRPRAEAQGVTVVYEPAGLEPCLLAHAPDIEHLFFHLIDNAISYTPEGGSVTVTFGETAQSWEIEISDTGIGISPYDLPRIYDEFYRGKDAQALVQRSTGLGLSIVKRFVVQYAGRITAESVQPTGTRFRVSFPKEQSDT